MKGGISAYQVVPGFQCELAIWPLDKSAFSRHQERGQPFSSSGLPDRVAVLIKGVTDPL
jgi:hypothetical protein